MDKHMKDKLKRLAEDAEAGAVRSILKWTYKKKGKGIPSNATLDHQTRRTVSLANDTVKTVWRDLKEVYGEKQRRKR
jgi:hypothetical protein